MKGYGPEAPEEWKVRMDTDSRRPRGQSLGETPRQDAVGRHLEGKTRKLLGLGEELLRSVPLPLVQPVVFQTDQQV